MAVEKLRLADQVPENEWELFCRSTPQTPIRKHTSDSSKDEGIPFWISSELWGDIVELDALPSFRGLKECIQRNDELWKEYFDVSLYFFQISSFSQKTCMQ